MKEGVEVIVDLWLRKGRLCPRIVLVFEVNAKRTRKQGYVRHAMIWSSYRLAIDANVFLPSYIIFGPLNCT